MALRRRRQLQLEQHFETGASTIGSLPDDLLAKCFSQLEQEDLLCRAALVCRRWFEISTRPELVRQVEFSSYGRAGAATLRAAQALLLWLHQHGQAVGRLKVAMGLENLSETELAELMSLLDSWLAVCGGRLERLDVLFEENVTVGGWIAAMPRLTDLTLAPLLTLTTWVTLERLTSLQRLHLGAYEWELDTAVSLPASLTCLRIESHTTPEMPHQLAAASLSNLRSLQFFSVGYTSASMAGLTQLSALQHAAFEACELPSTLAEMTGLEVLEIDCRMEPAGAFTASLDSALAQLTQLTGLCLDWMPAASAALPSLAALSQLNWLYLRPMAAIQAPPTAEEAELLRSATLPIGPWQRSLQQLVTTFPLVRHSLPFLGGAEQLQRITFMQPPASQRGGEAEWCASTPAFAIVRWPYTLSCDIPIRYGLQM
ncbi:hypothetical protein CHLNCDRAFT_135388 [Chlorella variabilis]|uniref:F-box domain-containing protein n=1 Tax=Chlorella variabilis TaxID=554065 RepID=E1ZI43_CHLVA|nr:hypothetical protein CHLNCDRAFT_135388 [Chlorella variabilis]EFN54715.1 hypothetical protein CHLNCDRAFT_135388 [Chlorella variabilis]|eukprot:XP_005846817.1 hypothetical protein CHLNCDRAFT_135388 [Chlorella variabilis]